VQYKEDFHLKQFPAGSLKAKILTKIKKRERESGRGKLSVAHNH